MEICCLFLSRRQQEARREPGFLNELLEQFEGYYFVRRKDEMKHNTSNTMAQLQTVNVECFTLPGGDPVLMVLEEASVTETMELAENILTGASQMVRRMADASMKHGPTPSCFELKALEVLFSVATNMHSSCSRALRRQGGEE